MSQLRIKRDKAIKVFRYFDFTLADRWDNDRMALKLKGMADQLDLNDIDNRSVQKIIAGIQDSTAVVVFNGEEKTKDARDGKRSKRKFRTKKDRKQKTEQEQELVEDAEQEQELVEDAEQEQELVEDAEQELVEDAEQELVEDAEQELVEDAEQEQKSTKTRRISSRYTRIQAAVEILSNVDQISVEDLINQANKAYMDHGGKDNAKEAASTANLAIRVLVYAGFLVLENGMCRRA